MEALLFVHAFTRSRRLWRSPSLPPFSARAISALCSTCWTTGSIDRRLSSSCLSVRPWRPAGLARARGRAPRDGLAGSLRTARSPAGGLASATPRTEEGATLTMTAAAFRPAVETIDFPTRAVSGTASDTSRTGRVPDDVLAGAVRVAQQTPSVCNRQAWRVHVYTSPEDKAEVLRVQNGNARFGHLAARILSVLVDTRSFVTSSERLRPTSMAACSR